MLHTNDQHGFSIYFEAVILSSYKKYRAIALMFKAVNSGVVHKEDLWINLFS